MNHLNMTINELKVEVGEITGSFYQRNDTIGYQKLIPCIDSLTRIVDDVSTIEPSPELVDKKNKLTSILNDAMEAMIHKDTILLADILKYDLLDLLTELQDIIND